MGFSACSSDDDVAVTGVSLNKQSLTLLKGATEKLTATVTPIDASDTTVTWVSSNPQVVSVDASGAIRALSAGSATVTVTTIDGLFTASCQVTVIVPVQGVSFDQTTLNLVKGQVSSLNAQVAPSDATNKTLSWSTSDASVATVSDGTVTAVKVGHAVITATTVDGGRTATCEVVVQRSEDIDYNAYSEGENW